MKIREPNENDLDNIKDIYSLYYTDPKDLEHFVGRVKEVLSNSDETKKWDFHYLVAQEGDKVVGLIGFRKPPEKLIKFTKNSKPVELYSLFVKTKKSGVGKVLVERMLEIVKESGYNEVVVFSANRWNESWTFYDKLGFMRTRTAEQKEVLEGEVWRKDL